MKEQSVDPFSSPSISKIFDNLKGLLNQKIKGKTLITVGAAEKIGDSGV